ncbi:hypothetical protein JHK82_025020 [Glycine max]|nr:hypothetical protein JHK85_025637 [Glycine max]KAG5133832.1 hypothetical protein JHK82_025020 [Glycine max]
MFSFAIAFPVQRFLLAQSKVKGGCMLWLWLCIRLIGAEKNGVDFDGWHLGICGPLLSKPSIICNELLRAMGWDDMLLLGINTVICKDEFAKIFTDSEDMILADSDLAHLLGVTIVLNSASQVMSGVAIGSRWQVMVGYINLACYYIVGLPIGIFLGFKLHLGVKGLWGGTMCSSILQILVLFTIILKTKWSKECLPFAFAGFIFSMSGILRLRGMYDADGTNSSSHAIMEQ